MSWLSHDSAFMRGLGNVTDAVWITILMACTSLPILTLGAAATAGHDAIRCSLSGEGNVTPRYFASFRRNFVQSTLLWLLFCPVGVLLAWLWIATRSTPLLVVKIAATVIWIIGFEWVWAFQARFDNAVPHTLGNAYVVGMAHMGATLAMMAIDAVYVALCIGSWMYVPQGLFPLAVFGYGLLIMLHTPIIERVFAPFVHGVV